MSVLLTRTFISRTWAWQRSISTGFVPATSFSLLQPGSAPFSETTCPQPPFIIHSSRMLHTKLLQTKSQWKVTVDGKGEGRLSPSEKVDIFVEEVGLKCPCLHQWPHIRHPWPRLPGTPGSSSFPPPPSPTWHLSPATSDHLQRWSGESGSRGNASCKGSHRVQRSVWGASSCRLGHCRREWVCPTPPPLLGGSFFSHISMCPNLYVHPPPT